VTLLSLIRKRDRAPLANANPAKVANDGRTAPERLARLASLALASPTQNNPAQSEKPWAANTAIAFRQWLIHYPDRDPVELVCCPEATRAEALLLHPGAIAAEPFTPTIPRPAAPLTASEETVIRAWLGLIDETDPLIISEVIDQCQRDADARNYFIGRTLADQPEGQ
jgi:hypothetical protein